MQTNPPSDVSSRKRREPKPKVSFARDIKPLFHAVDISHMQPHGVKLDDYTLCRSRTMLTESCERFHRTMPIRLLCRPAGRIGHKISWRCSAGGKKTAISRKSEEKS